MIRGAGDRLDLILDVLPDTFRLPASALSAIPLPKDAPDFDDRARAATARVADALHEGRRLVEVAERIVCRLYGVDADLEAEVVAHAIRRAERAVEHD